MSRPADPESAVLRPAFAPSAAASAVPSTARVPAPGGHSRGWVQPIEFGALITHPLARHAPIPPFLRYLIGRSVIRHVDSLFILEDPFTAFRDAPVVPISAALPPLPPLPQIERVIANVTLQGLGPHLGALCALFAETLVHLCGSPSQCARVAQWRAAARLPALLAGELGEPAIAHWRSRLSEGARPRGTLDKVWVVNPAACGFGVALMARPGAAAPVGVLIGPEAFAALDCRAAGDAFFAGAVRMGRARGEFVVDEDAVLTRGGSLALRQFGMVTRVRLVRAGIAHLRWLEARRKLRLVGGPAQAAVWLRDAAGYMCRASTAAEQTEDGALALKFAFNALLYELMETSALASPEDARDLLALTRLDSNSRHCLREIYTRSRSLRAA